jgi:hypothetical protein
MVRDALNVTDSVAAQVLDESVLDALGNLKANGDPILWIGSSLFT